jgi:hypothetical protein
MAPVQSYFRIMATPSVSGIFGLENCNPTDEMYMRIRFYLLILIVAAACDRLAAQYVDYGEDPARLKWRQINTEHYRVIYPDGDGERANRYANILETIYPHVRNTLTTTRSTTIPVVLHSYNVISNGMVSWAPKRMELLPSPSFNSRFQRPELSLTLHESRHIVQMEKQYGGIFRPFYPIFGEQTAGIAAFLKPQWLLEGDAVVTETALSSSGRGRMASFLMPYRAQIAEGKNFSLDKWFLGSYRDYTHDFYALGYAMTAHARLKYGVGVWNSVWDDMNRVLLHPIALKRNTGLTPVKLFSATFESLKDEWNELTPANPDSLIRISNVHRRYTSYRYPTDTEYGIICLKTSLSDIAAIVSIDSAGKERLLTHTGEINSKLVYDNGFIYWTEYMAGIRWKHENYSTLKRLDIRTRKVTTMSKHSRYFCPAVLSGRIAVFEHRPDGQNNIVTKDSSGNNLNSFPVIDNMAVQDIVADGNGKLIVALTGSGTAIFRFDPRTAEWEKMLDDRRTTIESLNMSANRLIFVSGYNGVNNIYTIDTSSFDVKRITNAMFGISSGAFSRDGRRLYVSDYSAKGYRIASIDANRIIDTAVEFDSPYRFKTAESLSSQESFNIDEHRFDDDTKYESRPYKKVAHPVNVHSWFPFYVDIDQVTEDYKFNINSIKPGLTLLSQNRLNTITAQASYYYDLNGKAHHGFLSMRYSGLFPVFQLKLDAGGQRGYLFHDPYSETADRADRFDNQTSLSATMSAYLPFVFNRSYYMQGLRPFVNYRFVNKVISRTNQNYRYFYTGIYYYYYRMLAHNDIYPKFGVRVWLDYVGHPSIGMSELLIGKTDIYFPGIFRNHSLRVSGSAQHQFISDKTFFHFPEQYIDIARGYAYYTSKHTGIEAKNLFTFKGDYTFPIVYPDLKIGSLIYLSRIRGNMFYDITVNKVEYNTEKYHVAGTVNQPSYGLDLIFDAHFFRIKYTPTNLMFRLIKIPGHNLITTFSIGISFN